MLIAWTTVSDRPAAENLAAAVVREALAACVHIDGPLTSYYKWEGRLESSTEFRLCFKCAADRLPQLEAYVLKHHPYAVPEWVVVRPERVGEKYLSWVGANSTP
jgi:periplasmic divalent cation tolerance protein